MPKWLWAVLLLIVLLLFIVPDPAGSGTVLGNVVTAIISFIRNTVTNIRPRG